MVPTTTSLEGIQTGWKESLAAIPRKMEALEANLVLALKSDVLSLRRIKAIRQQMEMLTWLVYLEPSSSSGVGSSDLWLFPHLPKELQMKIWRLAVTPNIIQLYLPGPGFRSVNVPKLSDHVLTVDYAYYITWQLLHTCSDSRRITLNRLQGIPAYQNGKRNTLMLVNGLRCFIKSCIMRLPANVQPSLEFGLSTLIISYLEVHVLLERGCAATRSLRRMKGLRTLGITTNNHGKELYSREDREHWELLFQRIRTIRAVWWELWFADVRRRERYMNWKIPVVMLLELAVTESGDFEAIKLNTLE